MELKEKERTLIQDLQTQEQSCVKSMENTQRRRKIRS